MLESLKTSATMAGTCTFIAQVSGTSPVAPNLRPAMNTTLAAFGSISSCARSSRSAATGSIAGLDQGLADTGFAEARHAHHPLARRRTLGEARQRQAHLAADAQHHDVAGRAGKIGDQRLEGVVMKSSTASTLSKRAVPCRSSLGHRRHRFEVHLGADCKPGTSSERSANSPPTALSRAGRRLLVEIGMGR